MLTNQVLIIAGGIVVFIVVIIWFLKLIHSTNQGDSISQQWTPNLTGYYKKKYFFTTNEYYFFKRLKKIFHDLNIHDRYTLFSKVKVRDIITLRKGSYDTLKRTNQWHFDFIICDDSNAFKPLFAMELDDPSHDFITVQKKDTLKNMLCEEVGLPLYRVYSSYSDEQIKEILLHHCV